MSTQACKRITPQKTFFLLWRGDSYHKHTLLLPFDDGEGTPTLLPFNRGEGTPSHNPFNVERILLYKILLLWRGYSLTLLLMSYNEAHTLKDMKVKIYELKEEEDFDNKYEIDSMQSCMSSPLLVGIYSSIPFILAVHPSQKISPYLCSKLSKMRK